MRDDLPGCYVAEPGVIDAALLKAVVDLVSKRQWDRQLEQLEGLAGPEHSIPLREAQDLRRATAGSGYYRPQRQHYALAHECRARAARLGFYGKAW
jgi:hypothetical protein